MSSLFPEMYRKIKYMIDYIAALSSFLMQEGESSISKDLLILEKETVLLLNALIETIPFTHSKPECTSRIYKKTQLAQLIERVEQLQDKLTSDTIALSVTISPQKLEEVEVWNFECTNWSSLPGAQPRTYSYLDLIFDKLHEFSSFPEIQLRACTVMIDTQRVNVRLEWHGPFEDIKFLTIPRITKRFWKVTVPVYQPVELSLKLEMLLLYMQMSIFWGGNELVPDNIQERVLRANLQLLRSDSQTTHPAELPLSETAWEDMSNYVTKQFYPSYLKLSQKLEKKLNNELEHRQKYVEQGILESDVAEQTRRWLSDLIELREAYTTSVSALK